MVLERFGRCRERIPALSVPYRPQPGPFLMVFRQAAPVHAALCAYIADTVGLPQEVSPAVPLYFDWSTTPPTPPQNVIVP